MAHVSKQIGVTEQKYFRWRKSLPHFLTARDWRFAASKAVAPDAFWRTPSVSGCRVSFGVEIEVCALRWQAQLPLGARALPEQGGWFEREVRGFCAAG